VGSSAAGGSNDKGVEVEGANEAVRGDVAGESDDGEQPPTRTGRAEDGPRSWWEALIAFVKDRLRGRCAGACVVGDVVGDVGERASSEMAALSGITEVAARASLPVKVGWSMAVVVPVGEDSGVDMAVGLAIRQAVPSLWVWGFRGRVAELGTLASWCGRRFVRRPDESVADRQGGGLCRNLHCDRP
jgi:hypothetical protein